MLLQATYFVGIRDNNTMGPALVVLLVALQYALHGYGDRRVWVRGPGLPDHCVRL